MNPSGAAREVVAAVGMARHTGPPADVVVDLGSLHPSSHGGLRLRLRLDGDTVTEADPQVGLLHRGAEKLFEVRDYRQVLALASRHDWVSAYGSDLGVALTVERMLGLQVPVRATWIRTLMSELSRLQGSLLYLSAADPTTGGPDAVGLAARQDLLDLVEQACGNRIHPMLNRVGGLAVDLPDDWLVRLPMALARSRAALDALGERLRGHAWHDVTGQVAVLSRDDAVGYGTSGAVARASGLDLDVRRDDPYLAYADLAADGVLRVGTGAAGDAATRFAVLHGQALVAADLVEACAARVADLGPGPVGVRLPRTVRAPEGSAYLWTEGVSGINGYYLVSDGGTLPWRLKIRSASFNNVQALSAALPGTRVDALPTALASFFFVVGDVDR